ncbi:hypothetical protein BSR29_04355 [Boudabousia liubingyangii]|uniref:Lipoprotein n=1 Tax=Boudabousia liubingyangii TaxID=1921764 RepID=A0A1Q5PNR4_9ACTO|nr:hypothetical protein [Boudabousia liubingyangii]OKL47644.1 hypothetical protein BSR28_03920 [Boudabousia liubingyangii]OKL49070.1 hypothetical protein BSR29_04355 [Boudabousia liubingyangii]
MKKQLTALALVPLMTLPMLTACGGGANSDEVACQGLEKNLKAFAEDSKDLQNLDPSKPEDLEKVGDKFKELSKQVKASAKDAKTDEVSNAISELSTDLDNLGDALKKHDITKMSEQYQNFNNSGQKAADVCKAYFK